MVAHLKTPHTAGMPASLHRGSVEENPLGIRGRWIPDDLEMGGCADWGWDERVRLCLDAGHVALLVCQTREGIHACGEALSRVDGCRIAPALERYRSLRRNLRPPLPTHFDHEAWKVWLEEIRTESIRM
jgi:beta-N-acetylhexosaminidase